MIMDSKLEFCDAVDVSAATGTANVGDVIDLDTAGRAIGSSQNISLYIGVSVAFASGTSSTVQFRLVSDDSGTPATDNTATIHAMSDVFDESELTVGATVHMRIPGGLPNAEQYLGLQVITGGATTTAGTINAGLVLDAQDWEAKADATN